MTLPALKKISGKPADAASTGLEFSERAQALFAQGESAQARLEKFDEAALHLDAIKLLAGALPKRECVHWALTCAREATPKQAPAVQQAALDATARWTVDPSDANRRAAGDASELAKLRNAAGCTALAAFMSGGSLAPVELTPVPPPEHLCAVMASVAIELSSHMDGHAQAANHLRRFFQLGVKQNREPAAWDAPAQPVAPGAPKSG